MSDKSIRISHPLQINYNFFKSEAQVDFANKKINSYIETSPTPGISVLNIEFDKFSYFNCIQFDAIEKEIDFMPNTFRIEISNDGIVWEPIIKEYEYSKVNKKQCKWNFSMISASFLKIVVKFNRKDKDANYKIAFKNFQVMIAGIEKIIASSENDRFWVKENIIDSREDYGWSSKEKDEESEEFLLVDLGSINRVEEVRILSKKSIETNFPEAFYFYYSEDDLSWHHLHEEPYFMTEPSTWYKWKFFPTNMRFFKLLSVNQKPNSQKKYVSQIVELEIYADSDITAYSKKRIIADTPHYASIMRPGLVRLAADGETKEGMAVQGNDRRLRDSTIEFKGIVELASDGEEREGVAVQGSDKRIKPATELSLGIVKLARNGEAKKSHAVQSDDDRIKSATIDSKGIVELAEDGETRPGVVVQGSDRRLKKATQKEFGLVLLAEHEESTVGKVVVSDDPRIKKATTEKEGILKFALNGEESNLVAVQGSDKRLKQATTESFGIVELAQSGEDKENVVVQGSDIRLKIATETDSGIVMLAKHGLNTPNKVVQSDDPRLSDSREAKKHTHDYANIIHDFNSHSGLISITGETSSEYKNINPPLPAHSLIFAKNNAKYGSGISGIGIDEGVIGYGEDYGVAGFSTGEKEDSAGIAGFSKKGYGGLFVSQKKYALVADGVGIQSKDIKGSGKALLAKGESEFLGNIRVVDEKGNDCIARYFKLFQNDIANKGDLLVINEKEGSLSKSKGAYSQKLIGVCVDSASIQFGSEEESKNHVLMAFSGIVKLNVDASEGQILPGDLIVSGIASGYGIKADLNKLKPGMLIAKSLGELKKDKGQILALICLG
jgi:hypothetical protein